ncbi:LPD38 domain-containing protein [Hoylesella nanceiensis]|uniref:LPD38 domain-containing protein n=1 Tax=Hoylesella nanceiensis TaxID=425941 RepID=UPI0028E5786C|nr:LPD38 domain-containing protein [Hoylesella nanceiensis]
MPNNITYTIKTADGKEHQVSKENIDKHGIQAYADAYEGATIRMRDSKKGDYDIPLANYNDAKAQGLHAFSWEHKPVVASQNNSQATQKQPASKVNTTQGTPMTAAQKAQVLNNANNIIAQSQSDLSRTMRKFDYAKQNTGLDVKPIKLGENRKIATEKNKNGQTTYLDAEGNRFDDHAQANFSQTQIEEDEAKRKDLLGYIDKKGMSSVNSAYDKQYSELEDFKKKHPYLSAFSRALSAFSGRMSGGGTANINQYRPEEARAGLAALALNQKTRQAIDEGKRYEQGDTGFWGRATRGLKKGLTSASTYDLGLSDTDIAGSLKGAADRYAKGQATQIDELLLDAAALNSETEGKYADALGGWFGAGEGIPGVASFMMQIGSNPMSGFGKATAQSVAKTVTKRAVQKFGTGLAAKAAITLAKGATRVAADAVEAGVVTAMYSPTKIVGDYLNRKTGTVVHDGNGGYTFEGKEYSDIKAVAKAINDQNAENLSEMWGDYLPGIGKVGKLIGKGARKIGLGKVVNAFEQMSSSQWMKTWNEFMDRTKWNGLSGEYMEEAEKNLYNALTNGDMTLDTNPNTGVFSRKINEDTFKSVALMSGIMSGISTVGYTRFKYKASRGQKKADNNAKAVLGAEKWSEIKKLIDNADDKSIGGIIEQIGNDNSLNTKQKMAILDYQYKSAVAHGANIQDLKNKLEGNYDEKANRYDAGYNATEDELANIKNELELRHRQLTETFKDDPSALQQIEEDPKAFLQGLKESEVGGEKAKVINAYEETRAAYDGMIQRVKDNIDDAITENNTVIEQRTHQDGNIYPATMKLDDRKVYVVGGNVQMNEDGKGIDHEKSSSSVMVRDAENGKVEMVDPSAILSVDTPVNAEEEKATSSEQIKQTYAQEQANKIDGVLEFKAGDTYSILGEDQKQHTIQIIGEAIDEKTKQPNPDMVMASIDGLEPTMLPKEQIQAMNDEENLWRLEQSLKQDEDVKNTTPHSAQSYNFNDEITLINEDGKPVRGSITTDQNEDGKFEVYTEEPINGKRVNLFTAEELDAMTGKQQEQTNQAPVQGEQMESPALVAENAITQKEDVSGVNDGTIAENATVQKEETPQHEPTALERIPTNEQGEPIYEQADPETAWDAILEQTEGDESIAQSVADGMVADMEAAVKRAEKAKVKGGTTIAEKIAAEKERVATIEQAKATLEHWKKIASTNSRRQEAIQAEESRKAKEAALLRKEQEEKERAMREEEERVKREALNGVPDIVEDKAINARARGYRRISGDKVDRQEPLNAIKGKEVQVKFDDKNIPTGHVSLIDVDELQPSHKNGHRNPLHFIDEAQPKERKDDASIDAARKIAANIRPEEITSSVTAYTGAPTVNSRGEVIQGNNRSAALKEMWAMHKEQGEKYKQYIIDHAEELGLNPADVRSMKHPVLVNMLDVNDNDAISLGQFVASDTESGGTERIKPKNVVKKLGNRMKTFANILLRTTDEDMSFAELIDRNGVEALKWMSTNGSITSTQYKSAFDSKGNLTAEAKNDLKGVMYQSIFEGGSTQLEEMFNALPIKAQKAILATAYRDYDSPTIERMVEEIQNSIMAYYALSLDEQFKAATNHKSARWAVESWKRQYAIDDSTGESYLPSEKYSNFALLLATMYKGDSQSFIQGTFKQMYDLIQGTQEDNLFEQPDNTPRTLVEAIKETLNIEYDGQQRSDILASNSTASQQGEQRSNGNSKTGGRSETRNGSEDYQGGTQGDSGRSRSEQSSGGSQEEVTERNSHLTEAEKTSENEATKVETNPTEAQKEQLKFTQRKEADEQDLAYKKELEDFVASTDSNNRTKIDESKYDAEDLFAPLLLDGKPSNLAVMTLISDYIYDPIRQIAVYDYSFDIDNKTNSGWQKWGDLADEYNAHAAEVDKAWGENDNAMLEFRTVDAAVKFNDWLKAKEDGKSNVVHSFGNSASQNDTIIKLSDTSFAKMENGEQKAEREIGWLVDHNIRLEENSRKLDEIAHLLFDGDNIDSNRESTLREEAKKILEENEKLSRDYQKNYSDKYFGTDDITANYILQEANERLIALGIKPVKESYYFQSRKNEVAQNAVVHLLKRIGIPVHFITRVGAEVSGQGNSRGWTNGLDMWLTKDNINAETPVHEYTHIWTFALMKKNPKLWAEIKNLLKDSEWVDKIQSMDAYKYTLDNEDLLYSEVLSHISGERNGEKFESMAFKLIEEVNSVEKKVDLKRGLEKLRDALKRFWEWVGVNLFGMKEFKSVDDVCDRVLFDLLNASDIARTEEMREYYEEEREMNTIIDKAKEDGTYLKTPNGEDTKLPEKVWAYARTKKFKTQLSDRLNLILNESKEDFKDWEKEEFRDLFKKHDLLEGNNEPGRFLVSQFMYSEKYYDRKGKMQEEAKETMNSGKGGENVSSVKSVDMRDAEYIKAVENNDTETIQRLLSEEAERKGYSNDSSYQGSLAFNGSAPYQNAYFETKEERKEAWENDEYEDTMSLGDYVDSGIDTNDLEWNLTDPMALRQADPERREAIENLRQTVRSNSKTITIYRAVDANIKENEIRNGDWVTPSRSYAEYHIGLQDWENGRVIEQEVSIDDLWWDGNDIAEWGYDNGKGEVYKNTPNNRKMFEVTYDDKGNIIPLSERFNEENDDIRYRYEEGDNDVALQVKQPIEQSKNLVALHNLSEEKLQQALELGGFPMPSIAITKANIGHTEFGNISLLFGKDSINPTDKRNKVYGGDAWTPTFPSIGYKLNSEKTSDIYRRANNVGSLPLFRPVFFHPDNYENKIDGQGSNGLVEHFKDDYGAKQMFLYEKGNAVEKFVQHEVEKYSDENVKFFEKILEIIGLEKLKNESYDSLENEMKKLLGQYYDIDFDNMKPFRVINRINSTIQKTIDYAENGNNKIENDIAATEEKIDERIDPKEFRKWLEKLFSGVVEKKGIRNEQDMFTPSGNRREWEKLYDAVTLDNAIKAMQTQAKKGGTGLFGGSIFGAASKELKEIEDIRNEAKLRINPISEEDYQAEKDRITERLKKVTIPSVSKSFSDAMDFVENVQDAVSKSHTAKGIYRHLHSLYPDMTMEVAKEIEDIVKDIQKISTRYLEAKPYRAVSFDEIKAAVVPSDTSSELIQQLKDRGIEVSTYEKDNQEQRKQIVNEVASKEELLFRNDDGIDVVNERFNEELDNLTEENADKVTLWLGKPSDVLLSSGIENKPLKLYGNKVIKKMKKHGFALDELRDLPKAVADPIAVFDNLGRFGNRSILTELTTEQGNFLVTIDMGKGEKDVDFNIVSSVFGKGKSKIVSWIERGLATYINKKKALNYLHHSAPIAEALSNSRLSSAANIVKSFENPTNSSEKVLDRKTAQAEEVAEKEHQQMAERANELAETLHLDNVEIVTDASTLEGKKAKAKGFYSTSTGKITIVTPNHSNIADVEKTLLHEAVAHHGLRKLFGEHFDNFLDNVFKNASEDVRREIVKLAAKNKWDFRIATEEYLASLAEDTNFEKMPNGFWDKVKRLFSDMLRSIGLKQKDGELNNNELRYILWRSYKNLKEKGQSNSILNKAEDIAMQHRLKVGNYSESTDKEVRFRDGEPQSKERVSAAERYEQRVSRSMFQSQEALQDSMLGLKEAMDAIIKSEGKKMEIENIEGFENAYLGENRLSSVNQAETEAFAHLVFKPMLDEVAQLAKNDKERSELTDYMMAKHGLERNEVMRKNALEEIINNEKLSDAQKDARASIAEHRDYAGLTALTGASSVEEAESEAQRMVEEYEQKHDTSNLWDKVNIVTKGILSKSYECGMMNKQTYEKVRDMYQFYIPLRGFDEETSREAYAYLSHGQSAFNAPIKTAKGRSSKADDPFANMQSMAESAIMQGNRNVLVKQKFLNFALNHPSDLVSVNTLWLKYDDVSEEWRPVFPDNIEETDTADEVEKKIQDFEQRMTDLAKQDPERYKHGKDTENIPYRIVESRDLRQHQVVVKRNGRDYVLTINGNPRAAQALNGLTNPDNDISGAIGAILNFGEKINRQLSAFYTTRNPDFVVSNFIRDMLYANSIVWVKERPNYALRFHRNIGRCNPAQMKILLSKHKKGKLDMNNSLEHMFHQFIMNGGETGYANVRDIEQHKNDIQRELKRANGKIGIKRSLSLLGEKLDEYNRAVENCARFSAFLTSREMGRTIDRSIYDAKDISVNFNKKGSGAKFMNAVGQTKAGKTAAFVSGFGRSFYLFWNAAIQGTTNFGKQFKRHPAKAFTASATMFILGALVAGMGMGEGDDDDKNSYWNLPESVRRSNILFRTGDQWISIPLPVEYRSIYGMGELMISAMSGKEHFTDAELGKAIAGQVTQILPIDFLEGEGGVKAFVPSAVKPFAEVISNKGWTGMPIYKDTPYNKNMPEWTKTYKSANKYLIGLAKILNEKTGGDAYTKGAVDINPAQIEYLLNGYFGGVSTTIDKLTKSAETIAGKRDYDPKSFLLLNRVLKSGDERTEERAINREYYRLKEEYEILRNRLKNYEHDTDEGIFDFSEKINFLYNSPEYARYEIFEDYREDIEGLYKELKGAMSDDERAYIERELTELKKQMIEEMNTTRK